MIQTQRLILRPPTLDDIEPLMAVFGDAQAVKYLGDGCPRTTEQVTASFAKRTRCLTTHGVTLWTVSLNNPAPGQHAIIGDCGLLPVNWEGPEFELAYRFRRDSWGNGYATEAARATMKHAWDATSLDRVIGVTYPENKASMRVLTNVGFARQGLTDAYYSKTLELFTSDRPHTPPTTR